jgi:hypothetical protein
MGGLAGQLPRQIDLDGSVAEQGFIQYLLV